MKKPDCYKCKYRGEVAGSAHSCCNHPKAGGAMKDIMSIMSIMANKHRVQEITPTGLKIKGNKHGIESGWFNHPFNFDPVWLEECDGFEKN